MLTPNNTIQCKSTKYKCKVVDFGVITKNMASVVTSKMKSCHITLRVALIWICFKLPHCMSEISETNVQSRHWPSPITPGNFETLVANLELDNSVRLESTERNERRRSETRTKRIRNFVSWKEASEKSAAVFDNVLSLQSINILQMYITVGSNWRFTYPESMPWTAWLNSSMITQTEVNDAFQQLVDDIKQTHQEYYPYETTLHILRRGDTTGVVQGDPDEIILLYFLKDSWQVNSYGELILYQEDEIVMSVKPSFNRAVVWNGSLAYHQKSPSMNYMKSLYFLMIKYTINKTKVEACEAKRLEWLDEKEFAEEGLFNSMMDGHHHYESLNIAEHRIKDFTGTNGRKIHVFDDLFLADDVIKLRNHVEDYGDYFFDDSKDEDSDNVQWISAFKIDLFTKSRLWGVVKKVAELVSGVSTWHPYDISCNNIRTFDSTQNHQDCETWEDEWTFLLYLNQNWTAEFGGETAFYSDLENNEYVTSIKPKFGRAVIFEGIIPHSARPPTSVHLGPRFSFAVKLSINPWTALAKSLKQEIAHEEYLHFNGLRPLKMYYSQQLGQLPVEQTALRQRLEMQLHSLEKDEDSDEEEAYDDDDGEEEEDGVCGPDGCTESLHPERYMGDEDIKSLTASLLEEDGDSVEDSFINLREFPEVLLRKFYLYQSIAEAGTNSERLHELITQFFLDKSEMQRRYAKLLELIL